LDTGPAPPQGLELAHAADELRLEAPRCGLRRHGDEAPSRERLAPAADCERLELRRVCGPAGEEHRALAHAHLALPARPLPPPPGAACSGTAAFVTASPVMLCPPPPTSPSPLSTPIRPSSSSSAKRSRIPAAARSARSASSSCAAGNPKTAMIPLPTRRS